jgi:predicted membrane protein
MFIRANSNIHRFFLDFLIERLFFHLARQKSKNGLSFIRGITLLLWIGFAGTNTLPGKASNVHLYLAFLSTIWEKNLNFSNTDYLLFSFKLEKKSRNKNEKQRKRMGLIK